MGSENPSNAFNAFRKDSKRFEPFWDLFGTGEISLAAPSIFLQARDCQRSNREHEWAGADPEEDLDKIFEVH